MVCKLFPKFFVDEKIVNSGNLNPKTTNTGRECCRRSFVFRNCQEIRIFACWREPCCRICNVHVITLSLCPIWAASALTHLYFFFVYLFIYLFFHFLKFSISRSLFIYLLKIASNQHTQKFGARHIAPQWKLEWFALPVSKTAPRWKPRVDTEVRANVFDTQK